MFPSEASIRHHLRMAEKEERQGLESVTSRQAYCVQYFLLLHTGKYLKIIAHISTCYFSMTPFPHSRNHENQTIKKCCCLWIGDEAVQPHVLYCPSLSPWPSRLLCHIGLYVLSLLKASAASESHWQSQIPDFLPTLPNQQAIAKVNILHSNVVSTHIIQ